MSVQHQFAYTLIHRIDVWIVVGFTFIKSQDAARYHLYSFDADNMLDEFVDIV